MVDRNLIEKAKWFHGHICPFLVLGLRISEIAMKRLGVSRAGEAETIGEELLAIVEANNCMADGVQIATGCTLGNNSLIYIDVGKNALTLVRRGTWRGVRVYIDAEKLRSKYFSREALDLFDKVVRRREGSKEDKEKLHRLWEEIGLKMAEVPEEEFVIEEVEVEPIERAPIFESIRCVKCGELVMAPKAVKIGDTYLCPVCADRLLQAVIGRGIDSIRYPIRISRG
ncbi:formylmethanofuran dehydrogenase, subunit E [Ignisphaera aggregans DSM 17230]|uniref:Formylmethanofuran dehydrogenase, subunit E n=1 Tax=Ignisphaera aggregans (strain DSM 17230 / JCM 13409 / AQ1.S1) TaxID=583356 RepID=E0STT4_IGNAA|nr:formylmethanofuran dehydrogenase, subunit E [Ignisphaera aggregans DSM 17230]